MNRIDAILKPDADGKVHLPVPPELRSGKVHVTATLEPVGENGKSAAAADVAKRKAALKALRDAGGLNPRCPPHSHPTCQ